VKSTYYRTTQSEIFYHRDRTLRKVGIQARKKIEVVKDAPFNERLTQMLGLTVESQELWIADTSF